MELEFKSKIVETNQTITLNNGVITFIGENGCGKSSILEAIFQKYIEGEDHKVICFSSGQNELFSGLFNEHKRTNRRYIREKNETINSFYFNWKWARMLVFCSTIFKPNGMVRKYLMENDYIDTDTIGDDVSSRLDFKFRIKKHYVTLIREELKKEELGQNNSEDDEGYEFEEDLLRTTDFHETLEKIISAFDIDFDFQNNDNLVKRKLTFDVNLAYEVFTHKDIDKIFSFWALATNGWMSNTELSDCHLKFKNGLEFKNLSDGEYQLLSIYAILDLFDSENTIFLFDEIDSHLYYKNLNKMWNALQKSTGTVITTTHISDSILQNNIENIRLIENGKIESNLTFLELSKRLEEVVGQKKYTFQILARVQNPVLMDHVNDWIIFRKLARKKIGDGVDVVLDQFLPIGKESSYDSVNETLGGAKLFFINEFKKRTAGERILTKNIFLICDKDVFPSNQILDDHQVHIDRSFNDIKKFNSNNTKTHLLCWKRREIENYLISPSMLSEKEKLDELKALYPLPNLNVGENLDIITDIREGDFKTVLRPLYNIDGEGFNEPLIDEIIGLMPANEISEDIEKVYNYLASKI